MLKYFKLNTLTKIQIAAILSTIICSLRTNFGKPTQANFKRSGIRYFLDLNEGIDFSIYLLGSFEPSTQAVYRRILMQLTAPVILDIGANVGSHTLPLAHIAKQTNGVVLAFEPTKFAFKKLKMNLSLNPELEQFVIPIQAMLVSNSSKITSPEIYSGWPLRSQDDTKIVHPIHGGVLHSTEGADCIVLDEFINNYNFTKIDLIKIDVDGNELDVIEGAWQSIERYLPLIIIEWAPHEILKNPQQMKELLMKFRSIGYKIFMADNFKEIKNDIELEFNTPTNGSVNLLLKYNSLA